MALASVSYGLVLRYNRFQDRLNDAVVQESKEFVEPNKQNSELVLKTNNPLTNPN